MFRSWHMKRDDTLIDRSVNFILFIRNERNCILLEWIRGRFVSMIIIIIN